MSQSKIIGAVEIGTAKTVVLVGEIVGENTCNIIGKGTCSSQGIKKGEIQDFKAASNSTHAAILAAEKSAQVTIDSIYLAQTGRHLKGAFNRGMAQVSSSHNLVGRQDIERAVEDAKCKQLPADRVYIHHIRNPFYLDGHRVEEPLHMEGDRLEVGYWSVHGSERKLSDQIRVINAFGLNVEDMIISSIASGSMVTDDAEKEAGVLVLDIGCGTTDYVVYKDGYIVQTGVIPVGGDHLTNDLSIGLRVNRKHAEYLKLNYGNALVEKKARDEKVWLIGDFTIGDRNLPRYAICQILNARLEELFKVVKKELGRIGTRDYLPAGIRLTGGTSQLPGIDRLAADTLFLEARCGQNPDWVQEGLKGPDYCTALGLLHYALTGHQDNALQQTSSKGLLRKVARILNLNFS
jgi:cell division protein FtsA